MYKLEKGKALVLRSCSAQMTSSNNFKWPGVGEVASAPDWEATAECGNGLHGWLYGQGDHTCGNYLGETDKWLVVEVDESSIVMLGGKCKFPSAKVLFVGSRPDAAAFIREHEPRALNVAVIGAQITVGDKEIATVGALGTATAGNGGTATAGNRGTATAGDSGEVRIRYWDSQADRYRTKIGYIGEYGLEPNVAYRLNDAGQFERVDSQVEA